jgi:hypothetical protein
MADSYPELIRQLADARRVLAEQEQAARDWYTEQLADARDAVARTEQLVETAADRVDTAHALVERVDADATLLWRALGARLGRGAVRRLGPPPEPAVIDEVPATDPLLLLRRVRARLDGVPARTVRPLWVTGLLWAAVLAGVAVVAYALAARLH